MDAIATGPLRPSQNGQGPADGDTLSSAIHGALGIVRRRWRTMALIAAVIFAAAIAIVFMMTPRFEAAARVRIDPSRSAAMGQLSDQPVGMPDQSIVDTEVGVMRSIEIARAVVRKLNLFDDKEFTAGLSMPAKPTEAQREDMENQVAARLLRAMTAEREKSTYIVEIAIESTNADKAARIANAWADQYIEYTVGRRSGTAERQGRFLDERLRTLSGQAAEADQQLAQYRAQAGIVDVASGAQSVTDQQIAPLASQLATAESEAAAARSKLAIARAQIRGGGIDAVSAVLNSEVIRNLRAQRAQLAAEQGEIATRYGPRHPESIKIAQQIEAQDKQIAEEANRVVGGLESEANAASARAASLRSDLSRLRSQQSADIRSSAQAETLKRKAEISRDNYNRIATQAQSVNQMASSSLSQAQIIEAATPPARPSKPKRGQLLAAGLLFALVAGIGVGGAQELLTSGLRTVADVRRLGFDVAASIPRVRSSQGLAADQVNIRPMGFFAEAFRGLRRYLSLGDAQAHRVIAITSTLPDEGKTTSSLSLARVMALAGERVLLIDADIRRATIADIAGFSPTMGLVEVLRGEATLDQAIVTEAGSVVDILPVAKSTFTPEDLFSNAAMAPLLDLARERYDHVVIDTPPLLGVADARVIVTYADAVMLAVKWNATPRNAVKTALDILRHDKANIVGAIYTMVDASSEIYGALYYSRKYAKYYTPEE
ncbi:polysaccharide biosynthesis tyrosine autokinase [Sphingomonas sp.]|uniref:GumC family protein n=1 Tax=Sphingomonas sp. TaxID=28214 RepID=UPI0031D57A69